jgi:hemin uptake protein HemP
MAPSDTPTPSDGMRPAAAVPATARISSADLFCQAKALEIEHDGKIYQLRVTRLGKLILTA